MTVKALWPRRCSYRGVGDEEGGRREGEERHRGGYERENEEGEDDKPGTV